MRKPKKQKPSGVSDIHCLYHVKVPCICIRPVITRDALINRLTQQIRLDGLLLSLDIDPAQRAAREKLIEENKARLANL